MSLPLQQQLQNITVPSDPSIQVDSAGFSILDSARPFQIRSPQLTDPLRHRQMTNQLTPSVLFLKQLQTPHHQVRSTTQPCSKQNDKILIQESEINSPQANKRLFQGAVYDQVDGFRVIRLKKQVAYLQGLLRGKSIKKRQQTMQQQILKKKLQILQETSQQEITRLVGIIQDMKRQVMGFQSFGGRPLQLEIQQYAKNIHILQQKNIKLAQVIQYLQVQKQQAQKVSKYLQAKFKKLNDRMIQNYKHFIVVSKAMKAKEQQLNRRQRKIVMNRSSHSLGGGSFKTKTQKDQIISPQQGIPNQKKSTKNRGGYQFWVN